MTDQAVVVLTGKTFERLVSDGGTGFWRANQSALQACKYVLMVANSKTKEKLSQYHPSSIHHHAFLVGKLKGTLKVDDRILIQISEYAHINLPNAWKGDRNPVRYLDITELKSELNLEIEKLEWLPFPQKEVSHLPHQQQGVLLRDASIEQLIARAKDLGAVSVKFEF